jgi:hypothetical protein
MSINFGAAGGQRIGTGTYSVAGNRITLNHARETTESFVFALGSTVTNNGGVRDTMTLTPPDTASFTYTLSKPR